MSVWNGEDVRVCIMNNNDTCSKRIVECFANPTGKWLSNLTSSGLSLPTGYNLISVPLISEWVE